MKFHYKNVCSDKLIIFDGKTMFAEAAEATITKYVNYFNELQAYEEKPLIMKPPVIPKCKYIQIVDREQKVLAIEDFQGFR